MGSRVNRNILGWFTAGLLTAATGGSAQPADISSLADQYTLSRVFPQMVFFYMTEITEIPDNSNRMVVVGRTGTLQSFPKRDDVTRGEVRMFLDVRGRVAFEGNQGLLSLAFDPDYADSGEFYLYYSFSNNGELGTRISRFRANPPGAEMVDPSTEQVILEIPQPTVEHDGGAIAFGPDGMLYLSTGDGGNRPDLAQNAQNTENLLGKVLRIDVRSTPDQGLAYRIPPDNPFYNEGVNGQDTRREIFAYGLRNPYRMTFDPLNGYLFAADVGQDTVEEISLIEAGGNYGWPIREGSICNPAGPPTCQSGGLIPPIAEYFHPGIVASIIGGGFHYGPRTPELEGLYLFSDAYIGEIYAISFDGTTASPVVRLARPLDGIAPFAWGSDVDGQMYIGNFAHDGGIYVLKERAPAQGAGWIFQ